MRLAASPARICFLLSTLVVPAVSLPLGLATTDCRGVDRVTCTSPAMCPGFEWCEICDGCYERRRPVKDEL